MASEPTTQRPEDRHDLEVVREFIASRQYVTCSCGWASPDLMFPKEWEALRWARQEHGLDAA